MKRSALQQFIEYEVLRKPFIGKLKLSSIDSNGKMRAYPPLQ